MKSLSLIVAILASLVLAGVATAAVTYKGHNVSTRLVGAIDASPCSDPHGCLRGIVELRYHGHHASHLVRCGHPKHLHVVNTFAENGHRHATVYACSRSYDWRLP